MNGSQAGEGHRQGAACVMLIRQGKNVWSANATAPCLNAPGIAAE